LEIFSKFPNLFSFSNSQGFGEIFMKNLNEETVTIAMNCLFLFLFFLFI